MPIEVVFNPRSVGFCLSNKAVHRMAELGNQDAINDTLPTASSIKASDPIKVAELGKHTGNVTDYYLCYFKSTPRHDPVLVQTVKELGDEASRDLEPLKIVVLNGNSYIIEEYDGAEKVVEPTDTKWIVVE